MAAKKAKADPIEEFFKSFSSVDETVDFGFGKAVFEKLDVITTSSLVLDDALSSGGLPKGRLIQFYGPPASGKTFMTLLAIREAQAADPKSKQIFFDAEQALDMTWLSRLGIDVSRVLHIYGRRAYSGQMLFESLLGVPKEDKKHKYAGKSKDGILDKIANKDPGFNFNLIVLDSVGQVQPPGLEVASVGQVTMGKSAKFLAEICPKLAVEVMQAGIPFIMLNHKRESLSMYGPDHTFSGGNSYAHSLSANIYFEAVARKDATLFDSNENKVGGIIRATVEKSKFGPHPRKCEFMVDFRSGVINLHQEIAELAMKYNIVKQTSSVMYEYNGKTFRGQGKVAEAIESDEALQDELKIKIEEARENERKLQFEVQKKFAPIDDDSEEEEIEEEEEAEEASE